MTTAHCRSAEGQDILIVGISPADWAFLASGKAITLQPGERAALPPGWGLGVVLLPDGAAGPTLLRELLPPEARESPKETRADPTPAGEAGGGPERP